MKIPIIYILLLFILLSCEKEEINATVSGRIVIDCIGTPLANINLKARVQITSINIGPDFDYYSFSTDANGNFSVKIKKRGGMEIEKNGNTIIDGIPVIGDINIGTFNTFPTSSFVYRIKVNNSYNVGDTLQLSIHQGINRITIPAPLFDTIFPVVTNYGSYQHPYYENTDYVTVSGLYDITKGALTYQDIIKRETFSFSLPACPSTIDTITIEIN